MWVWIAAIALLAILYFYPMKEGILGIGKKDKKKKNKKDDDRAAATADATAKAESDETRVADEAEALRQAARTSSILANIAQYNADANAAALKPANIASSQYSDWTKQTGNVFSAGPDYINLDTKNVGNVDECLSFCADSNTCNGVTYSTLKSEYNCMLTSSTAMGNPAMLEYQTYTKTQKVRDAKAAADFAQTAAIQAAAEARRAAAAKEAADAEAAAAIEPSKSEGAARDAKAASDRPTQYPDWFEQLGVMYAESYNSQNRPPQIVAANADDCISKCAAAPDCKGISYDPYLHDPSMNCILNKTLEGKMIETKGNSYLKPLEQATKYPDWTQQVGLFYPENLPGVNIRAANADDCISRCEAAGDCKGITFLRDYDVTANNAGPNCILNKTLTSSATNARAFSYLKPGTTESESTPATMGSAISESESTPATMGSAISESESTPASDMGSAISDSELKPASDMFSTISESELKPASDTTPLASDGSVSGPASSSQYSDWTMQADTFYSTDTFTKTTKASSDECIAACAADDTCLAMTYTTDTADNCLSYSTFSSTPQKMIGYNTFKNPKTPLSRNTSVNPVPVPSATATPQISSTPDSGASVYDSSMTDTPYSSSYSTYTPNLIAAP